MKENQTIHYISTSNDQVLMNVSPIKCLQELVQTQPQSTIFKLCERSTEHGWMFRGQQNITNVNKLRASHHVHGFPTLDESTFPPYTEIIVDHHSSGVQIGIVLYTAKLRCLICCLTLQVFLAQIPSECHHGSP